MDFHLAGPFEGFQCPDGGEQLHAVVGGVGSSPFEFPAVLARQQNSPPTSRPGIAAARTVRVDADRAPHPISPILERLRVSGKIIRHQPEPVPGSRAGVVGGNPRGRDGGPGDGRDEPAPGQALPASAACEFALAPHDHVHGTETRPPPVSHAVHEIQLVPPAGILQGQLIGQHAGPDDVDSQQGQPVLHPPGPVVLAAGPGQRPDVAEPGAGGEAVQSPEADPVEAGDDHAPFRNQYLVDFAQHSVRIVTEVQRMGHHDEAVGLLAERQRARLRYHGPEGPGAVISGLSLFHQRHGFKGGQGDEPRAHLHVVQFPEIVPFRQADLQCRRIVPRGNQFPATAALLLQEPPPQGGSEPGGFGVIQISSGKRFGEGARRPFLILSSGHYSNPVAAPCPPRNTHFQKPRPLQGNWSADPRSRLRTAAARH